MRQDRASQHGRLVGRCSENHRVDLHFLPVVQEKRNMSVNLDLEAASSPLMIPMSGLFIPRQWTSYLSGKHPLFSRRGLTAMSRTVAARASTTHPMSGCQVVFSLGMSSNF